MLTSFRYQILVGAMSYECFHTNTSLAHGFVTYVSDSYAKASGLYKIQNNQVYMGVDYSSHLNPSGPGRNSIRIQSNPNYNHGLFIVDLAHMPGSNCGSWPAL
jgi:hypothetical protein